MSMMVISIVVGELETVPKSLEKRLKKLEIKGRHKTILTPALLKLVRILRRIRDLLSIRQQ